MKATLKWIDSHEVDRQALPPDPEDCAVIVTAGIGIPGDEAADNFEFTVMTLSALDRQVGDGEYEWGRHLIVVRRFDWVLVEGAIKGIVEQQHGETWDELATRIGRYGLWEFEDYQDERAAKS